MKICRYIANDDSARRPRLGLWREDGIHDVTAVTDSLPALRWPLPPGDQLIANLPALRGPMEELAARTGPLARDSVTLLSPVANPGKFVCGAGNWKHHGAPLGTMGFMFKASSALSGEGENVAIRWTDRNTLHEPELAIVIGRECTNVTEAEALDYVAGYTCALDMTLERVMEDYAFCKSFDSYGMLGPCMVTADEIADPSALGYRFWVNDRLAGERSFSDLTGSPAQMIAFASTAMTLYPGDLILSGAADVAPVAVGDALTLEIPGIETLRTRVVRSDHAR